MIVYFCCVCFVCASGPSPNSGIRAWSKPKGPENHKLLKQSTHFYNLIFSKLSKPVFDHIERKSSSRRVQRRKPRQKRSSGVFSRPRRSFAPETFLANFSATGFSGEPVKKMMMSSLPCHCQLSATSSPTQRQLIATSSPAH